MGTSPLATTGIRFILLSVSGYVLRFSAELVKPFSPGATVQPSARFEVPLIKAESEFDLLPIPIFPRSGHFDGASAEVRFFAVLLSVS